MTITTRTGKGSELTYAEVDENFTDLRDGIGARVPKTKGATGVKVGDNTTDDYPWQDLHSTIHTDPNTPATLPTFTAYRGGIKGRQFAENDEAFIEFHLPHDYAAGTDIYIHAHWSHASATVTGGSATWGFECIYAKGHDQDLFDAPKIITVAQNASLTQYQHMIAETAFTSLGGGATTFDTNQMEPDAVIMVRVYFDSNNITDSVSVPDPFLHFVDLQYHVDGSESHLGLTDVPQ